MRLPREAFIAVTFKCNARCVMCDVWKKPPSDDLESTFLNKLPKSLRQINISGGEPFLRKDLPEVIRVIHERCQGPVQLISTNGLLPKLMKDQMKEILKIGGNVGVRVSMDGIGECHDRVRGVPNAFDKAMTSLEVLKSLGVRNLGIGSIATDINVDHLSRVYDLANKLKVQYVFCGIAHNSEVTFTESGNKRMERLGELRHQLDYITRQELTAWHPKQWFRALYTSSAYYHASTGRRTIPCYAGTLWFFMTPSGDIYPDMIFGKKWGNIKSESFEEIWDSETAHEFRNFISNVNNCPNPCWMSCTVAPYMKEHIPECLRWIVPNKVKAHLGLRVTLAQL